MSKTIRLMLIFTLFLSGQLTKKMTLHSVPMMNIFRKLSIFQHIFTCVFFLPVLGFIVSCSGNKKEPIPLVFASLVLFGPSDFQINTINSIW